MIFVGSSSLYKRFGHSAIDLVVRAFPQKVQVICAIFSTGVLTVTCALSFVLSCGYCANSWTRRTQLLKIPYSVEAFALVLGFGFMLIHSIMFFKNVITKKDYFHEIPIYENIYKIDASGRPGAVQLWNISRKRKKKTKEENYNAKYTSDFNCFCIIFSWVYQ